MLIKKILVLGKPGIGKSKILSKICVNGSVEADNLNIYPHSLFVGNRIRFMEFWDINESENNETWKEYYKRSDAAIIMYDNDTDKDLYTNNVITLCETRIPIVYINVSKEYNNAEFQEDNGIDYYYYFDILEEEYYDLPIHKLLKILYIVDIRDYVIDNKYAEKINNLKANILYNLINKYDFGQGSNGENSNYVHHMDISD
mgnify:CR=1 FL=1